MKKTLTIGDLDRVVKFVNDLQTIAVKHNIGLYTLEDDISLSINGETSPFVLYAEDDRTLSLVVKA